MSLLAELQRRSVFKVAAAYLVVGWLVVQAASIAFPLFEAPTWALRVFVFVVVLGFPLALVIAWAVELTPEGLKLDAAPTGNKRFFAATGALALLAFAWFYLGQGASSGGADGEGAVADARSIAVLPFVNMSGDAENEYFSDGISEEILNSLAQMPDVRVAARTSSFSYKGKGQEIPEIARELEVRMVLEGSVRKQGDRVRITAQLIDASKGFHVWSNAYDRELKDIFAIQGEIAQAIAKELEVKLPVSQREGLAAADTENLVAYEHYLKGMQLWQARGSDNVQAAERELRAALALDPNFAKAWAGLAVTMTVMPEWTTRALEPDWLEARDAAERAIALDPTLPEPYTALAYIAMSERRWGTGKAMFERVHALAPSYATAWQWHGESLATAGEMASTVVVLRRAVQLDPKSAIVRQALANALFYTGREAEAAALCQQILREWPDWLACKQALWDDAVLRGDAATARTMLRAMAEPRGAAAVALAEQASEALAARRASPELVAKLLAQPDGGSDLGSLSPFTDFDFMIWAIAVGRPDAGAARLERYVTRLPHAGRILFYALALHPLACEPRYAAVARLVEVPDELVAANCAAGKTPRRIAPPPPKKS